MLLRKQILNDNLKNYTYFPIFTILKLYYKNRIYIFNIKLLDVNYN